jgi:hypothetical protein
MKSPSMRLLQRCTLLLTILGMTLWVALCSCATAPVEKTSYLNWEVYFSPNGGCTDGIVRELDKAQSTVLVQAYSFTSYKIAKALLDAHKRGVKVEAILDKSQKGDQYSSADSLANSGIPTKIDAQHAIAHNKVMIKEKVCQKTRSHLLRKGEA